MFDGRSQLLVYHFMFGPSYAAGCPTCSAVADSVNGVLAHLNARDVTMLLVSQAPLETLQAFKRRMGWRLPWVSSASSQFNIDLGFSASQEHTREGSGRCSEIFKTAREHTGLAARMPGSCRRAPRPTPGRPAPIWSVI